MPKSRFTRLYVDRIHPPYDGRTGGLQRKHVHWYSSQDPQAVFILPDNAVDFERENAAGPLEGEHGTPSPGRGGLAAPMRPEMKEAKGEKNAYDFCAIGIPTGEAPGKLGSWGRPKWKDGGKPIDGDELKKLKKAFANIYRHLGAGKNIVVPYNAEKTKEHPAGPAFGYGIFKDFPKELYEIIAEEFANLEKFCVQLESDTENAKKVLPKEYRAAYEQGQKKDGDPTKGFSILQGEAKDQDQPKSEHPAASELSDDVGIFVETHAARTKPTRIEDKKTLPKESKTTSALPSTSQKAKLAPGIPEAKRAAIQEPALEISSVVSSDSKPKKDKKAESHEPPTTIKSTQIPRDITNIKNIASAVTEVKWTYRSAAEFKTVQASIHTEAKKYIPLFTPTDITNISSGTSTAATGEKSISIVIIKGKDYEEKDDSKKRDISAYSVGDEPTADGKSRKVLRVLHVSDKITSPQQDQKRTAPPIVPRETLEFVKQAVDDYVKHSGKFPIKISGTDEKLKFATKCYCDAMGYGWVSNSDLEKENAPKPEMIQNIVDGNSDIFPSVKEKPDSAREHEREREKKDSKKTDEQPEPKPDSPEKDKKEKGVERKEKKRETKESGREEKIPDKKDARPVINAKREKIPDEKKAATRLDDKFKPIPGFDCLIERDREQAEAWVKAKPAYENGIFFYDEKSGNSQFTNTYSLQETFGRGIKMDYKDGEVSSSEHGALTFTSTEAAYQYFKVKLYFDRYPREDREEAKQVQTFLQKIQNAHPPKKAYELVNEKGALPFLPPNKSFNMLLEELNKSGRAGNYYSKTNHYMQMALIAKFTQFPELRNSLLATGDAKLAEVSYKDNKWGTKPKKDGRPGDCLLGEYLEGVRKGLRFVEKYEEAKEALKEQALKEPLDSKQDIRNLNQGEAAALSTKVQARLAEISKWRDELTRLWPNRAAMSPPLGYGIDPKVAVDPNKMQLISAHAVKLADEYNKLVGMQKELKQKLSPSFPPIRPSHPG